MPEIIVKMTAMEEELLGDNVKNILKHHDLREEKLRDDSVQKLYQLVGRFIQGAYELGTQVGNV